MAHQQYPQYGSNPWTAPGQAQQPAVFVPSAQHHPQQQAPLQQQQQYDGGYGGGAFPASDPFLSGMAGDVLRQQGQSYLQRSQAFVQSKMGFLSGGVLQYLFAVTPDYVRNKLMMLMLPFLGRWSYSRVAEQLSGGHKYLPPRQDVNAPDLYVPVMALWTYCMLVGVALFATQSFRPEAVYSTISSALGAWSLHAALMKLSLWLLGIGSTVALLELVSYAGYPFVAACAVLVARLVAGGGPVYHAIWAYCGLCCAVFLVRTMKRVVFIESSHYGNHSKRVNYLLLGLAAFQFPYLAWLARVGGNGKPPSAVAEGMFDASGQGMHSMG